MPYIKVLKSDLTSLGLRGAHPIRYRVGKWVKPLEPPSPGLWNGGGLWVVKKRSDAKKVEKNALEKHGIRCRFFFCEIGRIIEETSYRIKTDKVRLTEEISV